MGSKGYFTDTEILLRFGIRRYESSRKLQRTTIKWKNAVSKFKSDGLSYSILVDEI
jgi:hypothetical protein